jgi:hypothetical protein
MASGQPGWVLGIVSKDTLSERPEESFLSIAHSPSMRLQRLYREVTLAAFEEKTFDISRTETKHWFRYVSARATL